MLRYSKLQDIVGEFPQPTNSTTVKRVHAPQSPDRVGLLSRTSEIDSPTRSGSPLPLARYTY